MKYEIKGRVTFSCWTIVEADSPEEALKIANERSDNEYIAPPEISGSYPSDEYFHYDSDGAPLELEIEDDE